MHWAPQFVLRALLATPVAAIYVGWPMSEQLPDVALVDTPYLFTLASFTYRSSIEGSVAYLASKLPEWLLFDEGSRKFTGTPSSGDVGAFQVVLTGIDLGDGLSLSNTYLMLVATGEAIVASAEAITATVEHNGHTNGRNGLVVTPGQLFSISFSRDAFAHSNELTKYYGRSNDRTSLPNWAQFDAASLTFSGRVPPVVSSIAPSVVHTFSLIAAQHPGFTSAVATFDLVFGAHLLSTSADASLKINGTCGDPLSVPVPVLSTVFLDGRLINASEISDVSLKNAPAFISLLSNYTLEGTFPNIPMDADFYVLVQDIHGNSVSLPQHIFLLGSLFSVASMSDVNVTCGQFFEHQIPRSVLTEPNTTDVQVDTDASWLSYNSKNMTLVGFVPKNFEKVSVNVVATHLGSRDKLSFLVRAVDASAASSVASTSLLPTSSTTSFPTTTPGAKPEREERNEKLAIGLGVGLGSAVLLLCLALLLLSCLRKRKSAKDDEKRVPHNELELTGPGFGTTFDLDDHAETACQLNTLNAMKLDADNASSTLGDTHVEHPDCDYLDERGQPTKSWRADGMSTVAAVKKMLLDKSRRSAMSMNTVNTEQLFSVRVVDDNSDPASRQSFAELPHDTSAANILRLDSDGNVVGDASAKPALSKNASDDMLVKIAEESPNKSGNVIQASSLYGLMSKLDPKALHFDSSFNPETNPLRDRFECVTASNGDVHWRQTQTDASSTVSGLAQLDSSTKTSNRPYGSQLLDNALKFPAKLVEFTRKVSLKESSHQLPVVHPANEGQIMDDCDSL